MAKPDDGGSFNNMTVRDWFAGHAMIALMSDETWVIGLDKACVKTGRSLKEGLAVNAYDMADAMIAERNRG